MAERDKERDREQLAKVGHGIVRATITGGGSALISGNPIAALPAFAAMVYERVMDWRASRRGPDWLAGYLGDDMTEEEAEAELEAQTENVAAHEVIFETIRKMLEAIDGEAARPLGRLARQYTQAGKHIDSFFRGTSRLLAETEPGDVAALRELMRAAGVVGSMINEKDFLLINGSELRTPQRGVGYLDQGRHWVHIADFESAGRLFHLLRTQGLATESPLQGEYDSGSTTGPHVIAVNRAIAARLVTVLSK